MNAIMLCLDVTLAPFHLILYYIYTQNENIIQTGITRKSLAICATKHEGRALLKQLKYFEVMLNIFGK